MQNETDDDDDDEQEQLDDLKIQVCSFVFVVGGCASALCYVILNAGDFSSVVLSSYPQLGQSKRELRREFDQRKKAEVGQEWTYFETELSPYFFAIGTLLSFLNYSGD